MMPNIDFVVPETVEALVAHPRLNRANVYHDDRNLCMWVRKLTIRPVPILLDIANMEAVTKGTGSLTRFLEIYEPLFPGGDSRKREIGRVPQEKGIPPIE